MRVGDLVRLRKTVTVGVRKTIPAGAEGVVVSPPEWGSGCWIEIGNSDPSLSWARGMKIPVPAGVLDRYGPEAGLRAPL